MDLGRVQVAIPRDGGQPAGGVSPLFLGAASPSAKLHLGSAT